MGKLEKRRHVQGSPSGSEDDSASKSAKEESSSEDLPPSEELEDREVSEEEDDESGDEVENSSVSGTDGSEVVEAISSSGAESEEEGDSDDDEDEDVSDTDQEGADEDNTQSSPKARLSRSVFLETTTSKATVQPGERLDSPVPAKFPQKPMIELVVDSNVWYQAYVIKESANEVKVRFPGVGRGRSDKMEWMKKSSCRIWTGSYKGNDWKHLGKGAWAPRSRQHQYSDRCGSVGPTGSRGRGKSRKPAKRRKTRCTPEVSSEEGNRDDGGDAKDVRRADSVSKSLHAAPPRARTAGGAAVPRERGGDAPGKKKAAAAAGDGSHAGEDEVMSPRPARSGSRCHNMPPGGVDEQHSEGEHYCSTHSAHVAESPGVFADQNSSRSSLDRAADRRQGVGAAGSGGGTAGEPAERSPTDPNHDPLSKWFEVHFQKLRSAGKLSSLPVGMPESGLLPAGFTYDAALDMVVGLSDSWPTAAAVPRASTAPPELAPVPLAHPTRPTSSLPAPTPASDAAAQHQQTGGARVVPGGKKRLRDGTAGGEQSAAVRARPPVKLSVRQVAPVAVPPEPAANVEVPRQQQAGLPKVPAVIIEAGQQQPRQQAAPAAEAAALAAGSRAGKEQQAVDLPASNGKPVTQLKAAPKSHRRSVILESSDEERDHPVQQNLASSAGAGMGKPQAAAAAAAAAATSVPKNSAVVATATGAKPSAVAKAATAAAKAVSAAAGVTKVSAATGGVAAAAPLKASPAAVAAAAKPASAASPPPPSVPLKAATTGAAPAAEKSLAAGTLPTADTTEAPSAAAVTKSSAAVGIASGFIKNPAAAAAVPAVAKTPPAASAAVKSSGATASQATAKSATAAAAPAVTVFKTPAGTVTSVAKTPAVTAVLPAAAKTPAPAASSPLIAAKLSPPVTVCGSSASRVAATATAPSSAAKASPAPATAGRSTAVVQPPAAKVPAAAGAVKAPTGAPTGSGAPKEEQQSKAPATPAMTKGVSSAAVSSSGVATKADAQTTGDRGSRDQNTLGRTSSDPTAAGLGAGTTLRRQHSTQYPGGPGTSFSGQRPPPPPPQQQQHEGSGRASGSGNDCPPAPPSLPSQQHLPGKPGTSALGGKGQVHGKTISPTATNAATAKAGGAAGKTTTPQTSSKYQGPVLTPTDDFDL